VTKKVWKKSNEPKGVAPTILPYELTYTSNKHVFHFLAHTTKEARGRWTKKETISVTLYCRTQNEEDIWTNNMNQVAKKPY